MGRGLDVHQEPAYFDGMTMDVGTIDDVHGARVLGLFGDSITTDHISPAGSIKPDSPAGRFLQSRGVQPPTSTATVRAAATTT